MNDKILTMAMMLTFIMIGINGFLLMASTNLYDQTGNPLNIYYDLEDSGYGSQIQTDVESIEIGTDIEMSSTVPSQQQGIVVAKQNSNPIGLDYMGLFAKLGIGVQLVLLNISTLFPIISPITNAIVLFAFLIQGYVVAYLGSILIRGILGRIV